MKRHHFMALTAMAVLQLFAMPAFADKQKYPEGSLSLNVNNATIDELISLPEIGPDIAKEIVSNRPYKRVEELLGIKGIAKLTLGIIRPYVRVKGKTEPYEPE